MWHSTGAGRPRGSAGVRSSKGRVQLATVRHSWQSLCFHGKGGVLRVLSVWCCVVRVCVCFGGVVVLVAGQYSVRW